MDIPIPDGLALKVFDDRDDFPECDLALLESCLGNLIHLGYRQAPFWGTIL